MDEAELSALLEAHGYADEPSVHELIMARWAQTKRSGGRDINEREELTRELAKLDR
eukprot:SAG11_NODE_6530_length_1294_cov_0.685356_2_plen_56_part_00